MGVARGDIRLGAKRTESGSGENTMAKTEAGISFIMYRHVPVSHFFPYTRLIFHTIVVREKQHKISSEQPSPEGLSKPSGVHPQPPLELPLFFFPLSSLPESEMNPTGSSSRCRKSPLLL